MPYVILLTIDLAIDVTGLNVSLRRRVLRRNHAAYWLIDESRFTRRPPSQCRMLPGQEVCGVSKLRSADRQHVPSLGFRARCRACVLTKSGRNYLNLNLTLMDTLKRQSNGPQQYSDWYTGRWWVGCYIWYSEEGPGRATAPPSPLLAVPNVTAYPSTASVPTSYYSMQLILIIPLRCKGLSDSESVPNWCRSTRASSRGGHVLQCPIAHEWQR